MDINDLFAREQVELMRAGAATEPGARAAHQGLAARHRAQVDAYRSRLLGRSVGLAGA